MKRPLMVFALCTCNTAAARTRPAGPSRVTRPGSLRMADMAPGIERLRAQALQEAVSMRLTLALGQLLLGHGLDEG
jgi:hypothetical protein